MSTKSYLHNTAFIIPTLNNMIGLKNLLADLSSYYAGSNVVIVNNQAGSLHERINTSAYGLDILVLDQRRNTGFAKACNDGAKRAYEQWKPDYFVFLNDDIRLRKEWIGDCLESMKKYKWFATTPLLKKPDGTLENVGYKVLKHGKIQLVKVQKTKSSDIDGLTAAALVVLSKDFNQLKGFDERFFAYLEDVDLFLRAKKAGKKFGTTTESYVIHQGQGTSSGMKTKKAWLDMKNWWLLIFKHWSREDLKKYGGQILLERLRNLSGLLKSFF